MGNNELAVVQGELVKKQNVDVEQPRRVRKGPNPACGALDVMRRTKQLGRAPGSSNLDDGIQEVRLIEVADRVGLVDGRSPERRFGDLHESRGRQPQMLQAIAQVAPKAEIRSGRIAASG